MDKLYSFTYGDSRFFMADISDCVLENSRSHGFSMEKQLISGKIQAFACCLAAMQKYPGASVTVIAKYPKKKLVFGAIAEANGIVRGYCEKFNPSVITEGVILEVNLQLSVGDYTGVVCDKNLITAIEQYFKVSTQINAKCYMKIKENNWCCLVGEQLPNGTDLQCVWSSLKLEDIHNKKNDGKYNFFEDKYLKYGCTCSKEKVRQMLKTVEMNNDYREKGEISVVCKFCGKKYII